MRWKEQREEEDFVVLNLKREWKTLFVLVAVFVSCFYLPVRWVGFDNPLSEALLLLRSYAREHIIFCLLPALFIAGAVAVFINRAAVMKYLGAKANKVLAYGVASVSGSILAVCSCTVLPLFAGIYRMGAGVGPATTFLYSGPAINVLAIILTARVLGLKMGLARAIGAILFSIIIGLLMHCLFRDEAREESNETTDSDIGSVRPLWLSAVHMGSMVAILVFANWGSSSETAGFWHSIYSIKWILTSVFGLVLALVLVIWFDVKLWKIILVALAGLGASILFAGHPLVSFTVAIIGLAVVLGTSPGESSEWLDSTWEFAKQIIPLLLVGVFVAGLLLGRPGKEGIIPSAWVAGAVGGNSISANFFAAVAGAFMYFATLTEVPILQGLMGNGMGDGPALALLLAGPALSLPSMLVIRSVIGTKKTVVFVTLVVVMATLAGLIFGALVS